MINLNRPAARRSRPVRIVLLFSVAVATVTGSPSGAQSLAAADTAASAPASDQPAPPPAEAWWTGSMLSNSAATLPKGHALVETYFFDRVSNGASSYGSFSYLLYGLADGFTVGATPGFGYNTQRGERISSGLGLGDMSLRAQFRLRAADRTSWKPAIALAVAQGVPIGHYDRLGQRPGNGQGSGLSQTTISLYAQSAFSAANGRPMRIRINTAITLPASTGVRDVSVYGTPQGFTGRARQLTTVVVGGSVEYSINRRVALSFDLFHANNGSVRVEGADAAGMRVGSFTPETPQVALAPGLEYSWTSNLGVLLAARYIPASHGGHASWTPAIAINAFL